MNVVLPVLNHGCQGPLNGLFEPRRAAEPVTDRVAEIGEPIKGVVAGERRINDPLGGGGVVARDFVRGRRLPLSGSLSANALRRTTT